MDAGSERVKAMAAIDRWEGCRPAVTRMADNDDDKL